MRERKERTLNEELKSMEQQEDNGDSGGIRFVLLQATFPRIIT